MRPIAIVPDSCRAIGETLNRAMTCLREAGIETRHSVTGEKLGLIWVDDENVSISVETLRNAGVPATELTDTDCPIS
jgi:hypothetical protein